MQGSAYDQVMKFVENGERRDGGTYTIKTARNVGHDVSYKYQTGAKGSNYSNAIVYNDKVKNIYDLEVNVRTCTTEAYSSRYGTKRVYRGRKL